MKNNLLDTVRSILGFGHESKHSTRHRVSWEGEVTVKESTAFREARTIGAGLKRAAQTGIYAFQGADGARITIVNKEKLNNSTRHVPAKGQQEKK